VSLINLGTMSFAYLVKT